MFSLKYWLNLATKPQSYIWIKAVLIKETPKATLIMFDNRGIWLPKAWIKVITRNKATKQSHRGIPIFLKISQWYWAKKAQ